MSGLFAFLARDSGAATGLTTLSAALMLAMPAAAVTGKPMFGLPLPIGACRFALTGIHQAEQEPGVRRQL